jgi:uncharacterized BrkB/YihY/UPF0761 family membrane protein
MNARLPSVSAFARLFAVFGAPLAWLTQLCGSFAMASKPCFAQGERLLKPHLQQQWTSSAMLVLMATALLIALGSLMVSWQISRRTAAASQPERDHFLALWGMLLSAGFALTTVLTATAFLTLPRCAG